MRIGKHNLAVAAVVVCVLGTGATGWAAVVWDFNPGNLNQAGGTTDTVASTPVSGINLTATGYNIAGTAINLYYKNAGGDEHGIGINGTLDNEITLNSSGTPANYIQINTTPLLANYSSLQIKVGSLQNNSGTDTEKFDLWASSTAGQLGTRILTGVDPSKDGTFVNIPAFSSSTPYISVTVTDLTANPGGNKVDNVLLEAVAATAKSIPEPASLLTWGILGLIGFAGLAARRRQRN
jgi:MYXO-CTERM domain-containing protein